MVQTKAGQPTKTRSGADEYRAEVERLKASGASRRRLSERQSDYRNDVSPGGIVHMSLPTKCVVAVWLLLVGCGAIAGLLWIWPVAQRLGAATTADAAGETIRWAGPDFTATEPTALLLLVGFAALAGSVVHMVPVFTTRAGRWTLEHGFGWWYLLRPVAAALLGMLFYLVVRTGMFTFGGADAQPQVETFVVAGSLAGLFSDRVVQRMLALLGSTDPQHPASDQDVPGYTTQAKEPSRSEGEDHPGPQVMDSISGNGNKPNPVHGSPAVAEKRRSRNRRRK